MYPYTHTNQTYKTPPITQNKALDERETMLDLKSDKRLLDLLFVALNDSGETSEYYKSIIEKYPLGENAKILRTAYLDSLKHIKLLSEILYQITGISPSVPKTKQIKLSKTLSSCLEEGFLIALETSDFFRELMFLMPTKELENFLFEIMSDKQDHAMRLSFLGNKYNRTS